MSRVGRKPIPIPSAVEITQADGAIIVKGPKGQLSTPIPPKITVTLSDGTAEVTRADDYGPTRALHGLVRALLANMVTGVTDGFSRTLDITGVGYRAQKSGNNLNLALGYSHPIEVRPPEGIEFTVDTPTQIVVRGIDKQVVGEVAARIRRYRKPEPYKGKGIRYSDEVVRRKAGKAGRAGG
jgi:large subunit ribosomal protein L6